MVKFLPIIALLAGGSLASAQQAILVDFGATIYSGTDGGPAGVTVAAGGWNSLTNNVVEGTRTGLHYADGTALGFNLVIDGGVDSDNDRDVDWNSNNYNSSATVDFTGSSVMNVAGLYEDFTFRGTSGVNTNGLRISGLSGQWDVYLILAVRTATTGTGTARVGLNLGGTAAYGTGSTDITNFFNSGTTRQETWGNWDGTLTTWTEDNGSGKYNYLKTTVTFSGTNEWLTILTEVPSNGRQAIVGVQFVQVPEPGTMLLVAGGLFSLMGWRRLRPRAPLPRR